MIKQKVLFLHSALGTSADLKPLMEMIQEKGHEVLSFDFSGHGKTSAWPNEFRIDLFAQELDAYIAAHKLKNVVVVGHSMGGYVALYHRANFEDSGIAKIFTYGTKFNWGPEAVAKEIPMLNPESLAERFPEAAKGFQEKHGDRWKQLMRSTAHMIQHLEKLDGLTREDLAEIHIPVVLMLGDQDRMVTTEETMTTKTRLPRAEFRTISHSKHDLERANLKEMAQVILASLD